MTRYSRRRAAFTLIELLVVTAISLILMSVGTMVYMKCLNVYQEGQGLTEVYQTAKLMRSDLRDAFSHVVPLKGAWVEPRCHLFPGGNIPSSELSYPNELSTNYFGYYGHGGLLHNMASKPSGWPSWQAFPEAEPCFSGPQFTTVYYYNFFEAGLIRKGIHGGTHHPSVWNSFSGWFWPYGWNGSSEKAAWWPPGFFGKRDGADPDILANYDVTVASWGWPRPDYRLDADADDLANHHVVSCWFYSEDRDFDSKLGLSLDNPNIVLKSLKFSRWEADGHEFTQLSLLSHHISGWDHPGKMGALLRADFGHGHMLRSVKIVPYCLQGGELKPMGDAELGCDIAGAPVAGGAVAPVAFDVTYSLRNPKGMTSHSFGHRFYSRTNPQ